MLYIIIFIFILVCHVVFSSWRETAPTLVKARRTKFLWNYNHSKIDNLCFLAICITLFIMASTRDYTGYDWLNYHFTFDYVKSREVPFFTRLFFYYLEPGFSLLNIISPNFFVLLFIVAAIGVPTKLWAINKYSEAKYITLLMYLCGLFLAYDMGIMRQSVSISMLFIGLQYIRDKKFLKFMICVIIGTLFHRTFLCSWL